MRGIKFAQHDRPSYVAPVRSGDFGISPLDEHDHVRFTGQYDHTYWAPAVFWVVTINCSRHCALRSNYEVTLLGAPISIYLETEIIRYRFSVHPVPIDELHECRKFPAPRITAIIDDLEFEFDLSDSYTKLSTNLEKYGIDAWSWRPQ